MLNNFIYAQEKSLFLEQLEAGNILDEAIVFIEDTKEIWNHGTYFATTEIDPEIFNEIQTRVAELEVNKLDKTEASNTYATKEELSEVDEKVNVNSQNISSNTQRIEVLESEWVWGVIDENTDTTANTEVVDVLSATFPADGLTSESATTAATVSLLNNKY